MEQFEVVKQSFELEGGAYLDEATFLEALRRKVAEMLDHEIDLLMSTLYRLDVIEEKIQAVLTNPILANDLGLAKLIIDRQKERIATKLKYKSKETDIDEEWAF